MSKLIDITGQRFGRLTVVSRAENTKQETSKWVCNCDCGTKNIIIQGKHLRSGHTQSCGCFHKEVFKGIVTKHQKCGTRLCGIWYSMKNRTKNNNRKDSKYYSNKNIGMCKEWESNFEVFYKWAYENGYQDNLSIDRIDNNKGYSPDNCRWISHKAQSNNKSNNRHITINGVTKTLSEWADYSNIKPITLLQRLNRGWDAEKAVKTPVK